MTFKLVLVLILASLAVIFIIQNVAAVEVSFLLWSISMSRALLIFFTLVIGIILGWFLNSYFQYRKATEELSEKSRPRSKTHE